MRLHRENRYLAAFGNAAGGPVTVVSMMTERTASAVSAAGLVERLPELVNGNAGLLRRGRYVSADIMIEVGATPFHLAIVQGRIESLSRGPVVMRSWSFAVRGGEEAWRHFWARQPEPGYHDIFALAKFGHFRIEGDFRPLMTNLLYFKALLEAPRALAESASR